MTRGVRQARENVGATDHRRLRRIGERHLDDFDAQPCRTRIAGSGTGASGQLIRRADIGRPGHVDIDVLLVLRIFEHRVRVRPTAGLHIGEQLRCLDVRDVEDPHAAHALRTDGVLYALGRAVDPTVVGLDRHEHQVPIHRDVILRRWAGIRRDELRLGGVRHVPDHQTAEVALNGVLPGEGDVRVPRATHRRRRLRAAGDLHVRDRFLRVVQAALEADARILRPVGSHCGRRRGPGLRRRLGRCAGG